MAWPRADPDRPSDQLVLAPERPDRQGRPARGPDSGTGSGRSRRRPSSSGRAPLEGVDEALRRRYPGPLGDDPHWSCKAAPVLTPASGSPIARTSRLTVSPPPRPRGRRSGARRLGNGDPDEGPSRRRSGPGAQVLRSSPGGQPPSPPAGAGSPAERPAPHPPSRRPPRATAWPVSSRTLIHSSSNRATSRARDEPRPAYAPLSRRQRPGPPTPLQGALLLALCFRALVVGEADSRSTLADQIIAAQQATRTTRPERPTWSFDLGAFVVAAASSVTIARHLPRMPRRPQ